MVLTNQRIHQLAISKENRNIWGALIFQTETIHQTIIHFGDSFFSECKSHIAANVSDRGATGELEMTCLEHLDLTNELN